MVREELVGTWKLVDYELTKADGTVIKPWTEASGFIFYLPDGYMSCSIERPEEDGSVNHLTYCGTLECLEGKNIHTIHFSSDPALRGTAQHRLCTVEGDRMTLVADPSIAYGPGTKATVFWQKA